MLNKEDETRSFRGEREGIKHDEQGNCQADKYRDTPNNFSSIKTFLKHMKFK